MAQPDAEEREGWGWPIRARKAHYFKGMTSLCGGYGFYQGPLENNDGTKSPDDCFTCQRKLAKADVRSTSETSHQGATSVEIEDVKS